MAMRAADLIDMPRRELQQLAKDNGIKANMKTADLIRELTKLCPESPAAKSAKSSPAKSTGRKSKTPAKQEAEEEVAAEEQLEMMDEIASSPAAFARKSSVRQSDCIIDERISIGTISIGPGTPDRRVSRRSSLRATGARNDAHPSTEVVMEEEEAVEASVPSAKKASAKKETKPFDRATQVKADRRASAGRVVASHRDKTKVTNFGKDARLARGGKAATGVMSMKEKFERIHARNFNKMKGIEENKEKAKAALAAKAAAKTPSKTPSKDVVTPWQIVTGTASAAKSARKSVTPPKSSAKTPGGSRLANLMRPTQASAKKDKRAGSPVTRSMTIPAKPAFDFETKSKSTKANFGGASKGFTFKAKPKPVVAKKPVKAPVFNAPKLSGLTGDKHVAYQPNLKKLSPYRSDGPSAFNKATTKVAAKKERKVFDLKASLSKPLTYKTHLGAKKPAAKSADSENTNANVPAALARAQKPIAPSAGSRSARKAAAAKTAADKKAAIVAANRGALSGLPVDLPVKYT